MNIQYSFDWAVGIDPYRQDIGGQTVPAMCLIIDDDIHVVVDQAWPGQTGTWVEELLYVTVSLPDEPPEEQAFDDYIRSPDASALLQRIAAGYDWKWSGRNYGEGNRRATLDEDAVAALTALGSAIDNLPVSTIVWWNVEDWFGQVQWAGLDSSEIDEWIADPTNDDDIQLTEDPTDYIMDQVAYALEDELSLTNALANLLAVRGMLAVVTRDVDGDIETVASITTPAGHQWTRESGSILLLTIHDLAHGFRISTRRARALAKNRHERFGIGQQLPSGQWVFRPEDLHILRPDVKYCHK